jgi:hypothetical protein
VNLIGNLSDSGLTAGPSVIENPIPASPRSATTAAPRRPWPCAPAASPATLPPAAP